MFYARFSTRLFASIRTSTIVFAVLLVSVEVLALEPVTDAETFSPIPGIFRRRCLECHNDENRKGELSLQTVDDLIDDGYVIPRDVESSRLIEVITPQRGKAEMPFKGVPLTAEEQQQLRDWVSAGAPWPEDIRIEEAVRPDFTWWSLKPLSRPPSPALPDATGEDWIRTPIDAFILAKLHEQKLSPAPAASRAVLIRRLYFDLIGLPPAPSEVAAFVNDPAPDAYERLVDRLLATPSYGERWARHWLDVAHYADTHGYDKDKPRPNAWPYRDYVIRSFNEDKPYARFVQEQIAGDQLWPNTRDGIVATGFLAAGPWDFIGHTEVPETKTDGMIARNLDRDDMVTTTMNTFCSTTVQCARCHHHKFDPITQEHYYSLQAVFAALDRAEREFDNKPMIQHRREELTRKQQALDREIETVATAIEKAGGEPMKRIDVQLSQLKKQLQARQAASGNNNPAFGYHSKIESKQNDEKWVQIDLGKVSRISRITLFGCHDDYNGIGDGFGFPVRYKVELSDDATFTKAFVVADRTKEDQPNPGVSPLVFELKATVKHRYLRVTATKLAPRKNDFIFALGEIVVENTDSPDASPDDSSSNNATNIASGKRVTSLDSIQAPPRWQRSNLVDGYAYGQQNHDSESDTELQITRLETKRAELLKSAVDKSLLTRHGELLASIAEVKTSLASLPKPHRVYAGMVYSGQGNFRGVGASGKPRKIRLLARGDIGQPRDVMHPGATPIVANEPTLFPLSENHSEGERRVALAKWIVRRDHPLTWRSIVNRVWQYHFDRGLVGSPNDFGKMGETPTHPELLDWLAIEFRDGGQSFKQLHRLIVTSAVYRQASAHDDEAKHNRYFKIDSGNRYLWRMPRRRLSAEEVRDAVLHVSGALDRKMYGPGFQLFALERPQHSPHYEYEKHDPADRTSHRRSIYRFVVRSQPNPFMTSLDCADSSQSVPQRNETVTPLQSLALLNNPFMLEMSQRFAQRLLDHSDVASEQISYGFELATSRRPTDIEQERLVLFAMQFGLVNTCRVLLNLNEFVYVD